MTDETIPQMRETIDRLTKDLKSQQAENEKLAANTRQLTAREVARQANYDPKIGELYAKTAEGDLTPEGLAEFASELGLPTGVSETVAPESAEDAEESVTEPTGSADLSNMARGGSSAGEGAGSAADELMTRAEWTELSRTNPAAAQAALAKGQVQISKANPYAGGSSREGNPFIR
jgi:hypothetical protein